MASEEFMKKVILTTLALLAGCDGNAKNLSTVSDNAIVLMCSGQIIDRITSKREDASYLIKLYDKPLQQSLYYYSNDEKRFVASACFRNYTKCQLTVDSDVIEETGTIINNENRVILMTVITINRRTGEMRTVSEFSDSELSDSDSTVFEGTCQKDTPPIEQPQKF